METSLPQKKETILEVALTPIQNTYYAVTNMLRVKQSKYERLDGSNSASHQASAIYWFFRKSYQNFVMILGKISRIMWLDLPTADTYIIFDNDWNPQLRTTLSPLFLQRQ